MVLHGFHHHDGVIHHQADGQHHAQQGDGVQREAQQREHDEGGQQRHGHSNERNEGGPQVLQEHEHHEGHQDDGLDEGLPNLCDGVADGYRGVQRDVTRKPLRHGGFLLLQQRGDAVHRGNGVGARGLVDEHVGRAVAVDAARDGIVLRAELHVRDVLEVHVAVPVLADDDVLELLRGAHAALGTQGKGLLLPVLNGLCADLTAGVGVILHRNGGAHFLHGDVVVGHLGRVEPHADGIAARAVHHHLAHAGNALELIHHLDLRVVGQVDIAVRAVR